MPAPVALDPNRLQATLQNRVAQLEVDAIAKDTYIDQCRGVIAEQDDLVRDLRDRLATALTELGRVDEAAALQAENGQDPPSEPEAPVVPIPEKLNGKSGGPNRATRRKVSKAVSDA